MKRRAVGLVLLVLPALVGPTRAEPPTDKEVAAAIDDTLRAWKVPGAGVVVVHKDKVVYLRGHGVKELGKDAAVTPDTRFGIGSCTKAVAATAIGLLVDDGKMKWDDKVTTHIEWFRLKDPLANREVTLRDLLCHRTGLPRNDELWYRAPWSLEETVKKLAHLEPSTSFRSTYEYSNLPFIVSGFAIESAGGMPWNEFVRKRLFEPLGMKGAVFTRSEMLKSNDRATPHKQSSTGKVSAIDYYDDDKQIRASGSIKAGVRDLAPWLRFQLGDGTFEGKRLIAKKTLDETHRAQMVEPVLPSFARDQERTLASYGLGWHLNDYRKHHLIEHGGSVDGFRTRIVLVPGQQLGIAIVVNLGQTDAPEALSRSLLDLYLGLSKKDWNEWYQKRETQGQEASEKRQKDWQARRVLDTKPSCKLEAYEGTYQHPAYGTATVKVEKGALVLSWSSSNLRLQHFHYDTFEGEAPDRFAGRAVVFSLDASGTPAKLEFLEQTFTRKTK